ncbi:hypothetical protein BGW42_004968 [Actinomortierella wolfii]|nr:hypothetical protein BGW42_004968 [Actinomortierella wolfii]
MAGSKYQLHYFKSHGLSIGIRALLIVGGADWSNKFQGPEDWPQVKPTTPYGTLPLLIETTESGETITIPEVIAIEQYLANKFGMAGSTEMEKVRIDTAVSFQRGINAFWQLRVLYANPEELPKYMEEYFTNQVPKWVAANEKLLIQNGSNGHVVGNKITYGDVCISAMMDYMLSIEGIEAVLNEKTAPNMFACKRKVDSHPRYLAYRRSELFSELSAAVENYVQPGLGMDMKKCHIV